jgi:signal-transduction protein with cAMP-binding, CBS, and nucleotidyltransferase domain
MSSLFNHLKKFLRGANLRKPDLSEQLPLFAGLASKEKEELAQWLHYRLYDIDEEIISENSPAVAAYFILNGSVGLFKARKDGVRERVQYISSGRGFGYSALFHEALQTFSARTLENSSALVLFRNDFLFITETSPSLATKMLINIGKEIFEDLVGLQSEFLSLANRLTDGNIVV